MAKTAKPKWSDVHFKRIWKVLGWIVVVLTIAAFWYDFWYWNFSSDEYAYEGDSYSEEDEYYSYEGCDVAAIALHGDLYTYAIPAGEGEGGDDIKIEHGVGILGGIGNGSGMIVSVIIPCRTHGKEEIEPSPSRVKEEPFPGD